MGKTDRSTFHSWYVAGLMGCGYAVSFLDRSLVSVAAAPIKRDLALSDTQFGLLQGTSFVILYCLCGIPLGRLADRVDRRRMIALGILFWTLMTAVCGLAGSFATFFLARVCVGLGEASLVPAGLSLIGSIMPRDRMARAVAVFIMGATIGNAAALMGGGYLLGRLGAVGPLPFVGTMVPWQQLFLLACLPGLVVAALMLTIREPGRAPVAPNAPASLRAALGHVGAHRRAYGFLVAAACCNITIAQSQGAWSTLFFVRHFGLQPGPSAVLVGAMFLASAPTGQLAGGFLTDRLQMRGVAGAQNLVMAVFLILALLPGVVFCTTDRLWLAEASYPLFCFLVSAATPTGLAALQLLTPARHRGTLGALFLSIVTLVGLGLGPAAVGLLTDHLFQDEQALGLSLLIVILIAGVAGPLLALAGRRPFVTAVGRVEAPLPERLQHIA
jgi:MFS family permease